MILMWLGEPVAHADTLTCSQRVSAFPWSHTQQQSGSMTRTSAPKATRSTA